MSEIIPDTNPSWGRKLPDGDLNSLVDANGNNYDNGSNFDEKENDIPEFNPEEAERKAELAREFKNLSPDEIPEGVRDAQDYIEYKAERGAREKELEELEERSRQRHEEELKEYAEKIKSDEDFLRENGFSDEDLLQFFYYVSLVKNEDGKVERIIPNKVDQSIEDLLKITSIKDLSESGLFDIDKKDKRGGFLNRVAVFADHVYYVTDHNFNPGFNERYSDTGALTMISSIIERRRDDIPLDRQQRDFIYDLYDEDMDHATNPFRSVADTLLFGEGKKSAKVKNLAEEVGNLMNDEPNDFAKRIVHVENKNDELRRDSQMAEDREKLDLAEKDIMKGIEKNYSSIYERVENLKKASEENTWNKKNYTEELSNMGEMLLRSCDIYTYNYPEHVGETMINCGIEPDRIIDTWFNGPKRETGAYYHRPDNLDWTFGNCLAVLIAENIPKEAIIKHIKERNLQNNIPFSHWNVLDMREEGFSSKDILECYNPADVAVLVKEQLELDEEKRELNERALRERFLTDGSSWIKKRLESLHESNQGYRNKGFSDNDIMDYMAQELLRKDG